MAHDQRTDETKPIEEINWHRLFGITLIDSFIDSNYTVELEKELSLKKQYLDIVIIKKTTGEPLDEVPAGLENLRQYNLLTYKSLSEPLDDWAIEECVVIMLITENSSVPQKNYYLKTNFNSMLSVHVIHTNSLIRR